MPAGAAESRAARVAYLLRHGEPVGGLRYRGWTDDPLSSRGHAQMYRAVDVLGDVDHVITSPLRRCAEFARAFAHARGLPLSIEPDLRELHFGLWEGRTPEELMALDPLSLERFWADPSAYPPPGGERLDAFRARVAAAWRAQLAACKGRRLLCVAHAGTVRVILAHEQRLSLQDLLRLDVPFASVHRLALREDGPRACVSGPA